MFLMGHQEATTWDQSTTAESDLTTQLCLDLAEDIIDDFKDFDPSHPDPVEAFKLLHLAGSHK
jgi:hypothetical protein